MFKKILFCYGVSLGFFILQMKVAPAQSTPTTLALNPVKVKELLLAQGLGVSLLQLEWKASQQDLPQTQARFDTFLSFSGDHTIDQSARTSSFFGTRTDTTHLSIGLDKKLSTGTTLGTHFLTERVKIFNPNPVVGTPAAPTYEPTLAFTLNQPLGQNFFGRLDRAEVDRVRHVLEGLDLATRRKIDQLIVQAQTYFWRWALSLENVSVGQEALREAQDFLALIAEKEKLGLAEETDRWGAKALVARRSALLAELQSQVVLWESSLKVALFLPPELHLNALPPTLPSVPESETEAIAFALAHRLDLKSFHSALESQKISVVIAKQKRLPTIDLAGSLKLNEVAAGDYFSAAESLNSPEWKVGLEFKFPLENRQGRGLKAQAEYQKTKALYELKQLEQNIVQETSQKWRTVRLFQKKWEARIRAAELERQKLTVSLAQYRQGRHHAEQILQYQNDYLEARQGQLQSKLDYALALLDYRQAKNEEL